MGGWINIIISAVAAYLFYRTNSTLWMVLSIANCLLSFWSFGVMHNYASSAKRSIASRLRENMEAEGRLDRDAMVRLDRLERSVDPGAIPNWIATINMVSFVFGVILILMFFIKK
jgi:hypothetical protein